MRLIIIDAKGQNIMDTMSLDKTSSITQQENYIVEHAREHGNNKSLTKKDLKRVAPKTVKVNNEFQDYMNKAIGVITGKERGDKVPYYVFIN